MCHFDVYMQVAERVRDPYRVAWGLPWANAVMGSAPNALLACTPLVSGKILFSSSSMKNMAFSEQRVLAHPGIAGRLQQLMACVTVITTTGGIHAEVSKTSLTRPTNHCHPAKRSTVRVHTPSSFRS